MATHRVSPSAVMKSIYCEIIYFRWIFNFVYFMGRAIHEVKIPMK